MLFFNTLFIAISLSIDSFSIALAIGAFFQTISNIQKFKLILNFASFHFVMLLLGWYFGNYILEYIEAFDHWIIFAFLGLVGIKMIIEAKNNNIDEIKETFFSLKNMLFLGLITSLDALAIGVTFALAKDSIWMPCITTSIVIAIMTFLGIISGKKLSENFPNKIRIVAGIVLILIGVSVVLDHLQIIQLAL